MLLEVRMLLWWRVTCFPPVRLTQGLLNVPGWPCFTVSTGSWSSSPPFQPLTLHPLTPPPICAWLQWPLLSVVLCCSALVSSAVLHCVLHHVAVKGPVFCRIPFQRSGMQNQQPRLLHWSYDKRQNVGPLKKKKRIHQQKKPLFKNFQKFLSSVNNQTSSLLCERMMACCRAKADNSFR